MSNENKEDFTEKERETINLHHKISGKISMNKMQKVWRDDKGTLCVKYLDGNWWHYNEKGEWW